MHVTCPYCQHRIRVEGAHAGRFRPACDRCLNQFSLIIPSEPDGVPMVTPLDPSRRKRNRHKSHSPG